ncbi:hypothetical protein J2X76_000724 [Neorhizobium sp. 2083]|uniref:hypothetical protein n=1 Tax=Neorhizobium sp. 2083 TaxID=2817762 RepID=UPI00285FAFD5|nr:hypothetical protein [Neorhizobium sp. 2083]MDR6815570.1 hypothetical protein [Neorhizobium sp. 2083]
MASSWTEARCGEPYAMRTTMRAMGVKMISLNLKLSNLKYTDIYHSGLIDPYLPSIAAVFPGSCSSLRNTKKAPERGLSASIDG